MTFSGDLAAATGTFAGDLAASGGTFSGTLAAPVVYAGSGLAGLNPALGLVVSGGLANAAVSPTAFVRLDAGTSLPASAIRYVDLAPGSGNFVQHERLVLTKAGDALFMGTVRVQAGANGLEVLDSSGALVGSVRADGTAFVLAPASGAALLSIGADDRSTLAGTTTLAHFHAPLIERGNTGSALAVAWDAGNAQSAVLNSATVAVTMTGARAGGEYQLILIQDATGGRAVTWPSGIQWLNATPEQPATAANAFTRFRFQALGGGTFLAVAEPFGASTLTGPSAAPSGLSGTGEGACSGRVPVYTAYLTWTNGDATADTQVFRTGNATPLVTVDPGVTTAEVPGVSGTTTYFVRHAKGGIVSADSATASVTTDVVDCSPPIEFP